jgi:hypothetical protein
VSPTAMRASAGRTMNGRARTATRTVEAREEGAKELRLVEGALLSERLQAGAGYFAALALHVRPVRPKAEGGNRGNGGKGQRAGRHEPDEDSTFANQLQSP